MLYYLHSVTHSERTTATMAKYCKCPPPKKLKPVFVTKSLVLLLKFNLIIISSIIFNHTNATQYSRKLDENCERDGGHVTLLKNDSLELHITTLRMTKKYCTLVIQLPETEYVRMTLHRWIATPPHVNDDQKKHGFKCDPNFSIGLYSFCTSRPEVGNMVEYQRSRNRNIRAVIEKVHDGQLEADMTFIPGRKKNTDESSRNSSSMWIGIGFGIFVAMLVVTVSLSTLKQYMKRRMVTSLGRSDPVMANTVILPTHPNSDTLPMDRQQLTGAQSLTVSTQTDEVPAEFVQQQRRPHNPQEYHMGIAESPPPSYESVIKNTNR